MRGGQGPSLTERRISRRALLLLGVKLGVIGGLGWRMRQLGVEQSNEFRLLAEENRISHRLIPPARGLIHARGGEVLAYNQPSYKISIIREQAGDPEEVLKSLSQIVPISPEDIQNTLKTIGKRSAFVPVAITDDLSWDHLAIISANAPSLPGIVAEVGLRRVYPRPESLAHVIGFVGPVSDYDLSKITNPDPLLQIPKFQIGKNGVEGSKEDELRGKAGVKRIEVNAVGRVMREIGYDAEQIGKDLQLTIDLDLQEKVQERLGNQSATAVIMEVATGDIIAMGSAPTYDPNKFVRGISVPDWRALNENKLRPMMNKAVSDTYPPGSTFKMVVALAALEAGVVTPRETVRCTGHIEIPGGKKYCWRRGGHGNMNLKNSLKQSCDVYYYELASRVGVEKITEMANRLGLGIKPELPLPAVRRGLAPTKAWKQEVRGKSWVIGDTLNVGIGQGLMLASPVQLAIMTARIASGKQISPNLVHALGNSVNDLQDIPDLDIDPSHLAAVRQGMFAVVNEPRGTAGGSKLKMDVKMSGKTGTSQVRFITAAERANGVIKNEDLPWERRDHALFVGFAPHDAPKYAVSVVVEHGGGGSKAAAPIARDILQFALEMGERPYRPRQQVSGNTSVVSGRA